MTPESTQLVTIIAAQELEDRLLHTIKAIGARGYTIAQVRGQGIHGSRTSEYEGENVRIETIVDDRTAQLIEQEIASRYFSEWAVVIYVTNVKVLRPDRFISERPNFRADNRHE